MTYKVTLSQGLGKPIYVEAESIDEAAKKAIGRFRAHCTAMDDWPIEKVISDIEQSTESAVQYA